MHIENVFSRGNLGMYSIVAKTYKSTSKFRYSHLVNSFLSVIIAKTTWLIDRSQQTNNSPDRLAKNSRKIRKHTPECLFLNPRNYENKFCWPSTNIGYVLQTNKITRLGTLWKQSPQLWWKHFAIFCLFLSLEWQIVACFIFVKFRWFVCFSKQILT